MTFSILAYDENSGILGGAAATGSLCVGGWVLRGTADAGMSASQGTAPSTIWGEDVLARMKGGTSAALAVERTTDADSGRMHRQLAALDLGGRTGYFTGSASVPACGGVCARHVVVTGNMLESVEVLDAVLEGYLDAPGPMHTRLIAALKAGEAAGGDARGLLSAALLMVSRNMAPLTLRIDCDTAPVSALDRLCRRAHTAPYSDWSEWVPTLNDPYRHPPPEALAQDET